MYHLILDIGKVLILKPKEETLFGQLALEHGIDAGRAKTVWTSYQDRLHIGRATFSDVVETLNRKADNRLTVDDLITALCQGEEVNMELIRFCKEYSDLFDTSILSDNSHEMKAIRERQLDLPSWTRARVYSCDEKITKKDERLFRTILERPGTDPRRCAFVDDIKEHTDRAEMLGIYGLQYTSNERIIPALRAWASGSL